MSWLTSSNNQVQQLLLFLSFCLCSRKYDYRLFLPRTKETGSFENNVNILKIDSAGMFQGCMWPRSFCSKTGSSEGRVFL